MNVWAEEISLKGERWWFVPINKFAKVRIASNRVRSWFVEFGLLRMTASHLFHSYLFQCVFFTTCQFFFSNNSSLFLSGDSSSGAQDIHCLVQFLLLSEKYPTHLCGNNQWCGEVQKSRELNWVTTSDIVLADWQSNTNRVQKFYIF